MKEINTEENMKCRWRQNMVHRASGRSNGEQRYEEADLCRCAGAVYNANTKKSCRIE